MANGKYGNFFARRQNEYGPTAKREGRASSDEGKKITILPVSHVVLSLLYDLIKWIIFFFASRNFFFWKLFNKCRMVPPIHSLSLQKWTLKVKWCFVTTQSYSIDSLLIWIDLDCSSLSLRVLVARFEKWM